MSAKTRFNDIKQQEFKDVITIVGFITLILLFTLLLTVKFMSIIKTITDESGKEIKIDFDDLQYQHLESIDHSNIYECRGTGDNGKTYSGTIEICCFQDVEEVTW